MPDIEPFVSTIDGTVITGRAALREHNKRHDVTNAADYKNEWAQKAKERAEFFTQAKDSSRVRDLVQAYEKLRRT